MDLSVLKHRAAEYGALCQPTRGLIEALGDGTDGAVWRSSRDTAIKAFESKRGYCNERDCYLRLLEYGLVRKIDQFWVPGLIDYCDKLMVIEMEMVTQTPYILDFAKVRIDRPPEFSDETREDCEQSGLELFGHRWPEVCGVLATLESFGIYYLDPKPGNIVFDDVAG
jgi:hypothetical protein